MNLEMDLVPLQWIGNLGELIIFSDALSDREDEHNVSLTRGLSLVNMKLSSSMRRSNSRVTNR